MLGYPDAALGDADCALKDAREIGHAATWMYALNHAAIFAHIHCGNYKAAKAELEELVVLANEKGAPFWKALATINKGLLLALDGNVFDAIKMFTSGMAAYQSTGATLYRPQHLSYLASAHAKVGQFEEAWRCISEAITVVETTKESWYEAEVNRVAGEVALKNAGAGCGKSGSLLRARARSCSSTTNKILGTPRCHEPRASLA